MNSTERIITLQERAHARFDVLNHYLKLYNYPTLESPQTLFHSISNAYEMGNFDAMHEMVQCLEDFIRKDFGEIGVTENGELYLNSVDF